MSQSAQGGGGGVDISTLSVQQLSALQARLSQELEHLSTSYQRLRAAQARFRDCIKSIQDGVEGKSGGTSIALHCIALPLSSTFYTLFEGEEIRCALCVRAPHHGSQHRIKDLNSMREMKPYIPCKESTK
jgi:prefoldin alpha subunit